MKDKDILNLIQKSLPGVETIEGRGRDSLDFHDCHIVSLVRIVKDAFEAGRKFEKSQDLEYRK